MFIILGILGLVAGGALAYKPSREYLQINVGGFFKGATSPAQKARLKYDNAKKDIPAIRAKVVKTMGARAMRVKDVQAQAAIIEKLKKELAQAQKIGANPEVLLGIGKDFAKAKAALTAAQARAEAATAAAKEAQDSLQEIVDQLEDTGAQIEGMEADHELAEVIKFNAGIRQQSNDMHSKLSELGEAMRAGQRELEEARAADELSKGKTSDVERAKIARDSAAADGLAELQAMLNPAAKPAEVTVPAATPADELNATVGKNS